MSMVAGEFKTTIRPNDVLLGALGAYEYTPDITATIKLLGTGGDISYDFKPPIGETWSPGSVKVTIYAITGGATGHATIGLYDGTNHVQIEGIDSAVVGTSISFGSSATGPIRLTNSLWLRIRLVTTGPGGSDVSYHFVVSIDKGETLV